MKTKILKRVLMIGAAALVAAALNVAVAHAADATCYDITGSGQAVYYGGTGNSGVVHFDDPYQPVSANRGCARNVAGPELELEGWVWNTNLGWISLYCPGGASAQNQGIDCGTYPYGVMVDQDTGVLTGYAWGENTGWISFNCENDEIGCGASNLHEVFAETDQDCIGTIYSTATFPTPPNCPAHTEYDAFAWSDSVGWLDLSGVVIPFPPQLRSVDPESGVEAGGDTVTLEGANFSEPVYFKAVTVDNTGGGALTGYQVSFDLDTDTLITAGKIRSDCGDLRVFNTDQVTALPHWIEDGTCDSATTTVWTKVDVGAGSTKTIYASYNGLTGTESPEGVFDFFEDFESYGSLTEMAANGWTDISINGGEMQFSASGGIAGSKAMQLDEDTGSAWKKAEAYYALSQFNKGLILEWDWYEDDDDFYTGVNGFNDDVSVSSGCDSDQGSNIVAVDGNCDALGNDVFITGSGGTLSEVDADFTRTGWKHAKIVWDNTSKFFAGGVEEGSSSSNIPDGPLYLHFSEFPEGGPDIGPFARFDNIFTRQNAATPPTMSLGSETSGTVSVKFGANTSASVARTDSTTLTALVPASTTGSGAVDVTVTNPGGQAFVLDNGYTYDPPPTVTLVDPEAGTTAGFTSVTITGADFVKTYEVPVTITNTGSALTDYQVSFILNTASLIAADKMRGDCGDLRVKDTDGTTGIRFWIQDETCDTSSTKVWAKVPSVAASGDTVIYVNYGDVNLTSMSDGNNVFEFFDDFEDDSLDSAKWFNTSASESGGYAYATTDGNGWRGILGRQYFGSGYVLEHAVKYAGDTGAQGSGAHGLWQNWISDQRTTFDEGCVEGKMCVRQTDASDTEAASSGQNLSADWKLARIEWTGTGSDYYALRSDAWSFSDSLSTYNPFVGMRVLYAANDTVGANGSVEMWVYWTLTRKYASAEPTTAVGSESATGSPTVAFDGLPATSVAYVDSTTLTALTPAHPEGFVDVTVTNPDGQTETLTDGYEYVDPPTVTDVDPDLGPIDGGQSVTITGTNFFGSPTVTFGGVPASDIVVVNDTTITVTTPVHAAGLVNVVVTTLSGPGTLTDGYEYIDPPTVTDVTPDQGPTAGGQSVTITGTNFYGSPTVTFGGVPAGDIVVVNETTITATTPVHAAGLVNVVVTTLSGPGTLTDGYEYMAAPTVTDVTPDQGPTAGGQSVTITGTNFYGSPTVTFGGFAATSIIVVNDTTITCVTPLHAYGYVNVVVTTLSGSGTLVNGYEYVAQSTVLSVVPDQGPTSGGTDVTITGTNFYGTPTVSFGGSAATAVILVNPTTITCTTPEHVSGLVDVSVTTPAGTGTLTDGFRYTCAVGAAEQCIETTITGAITFDVPDDITFPPLEAKSVEQANYSYGATGYEFNVNDLLSVYDTRSSGGFEVQAQLSTPFEIDPARYISLENFYIATTSSETGGFRFDPPSDDGIEYDSSPVTACDGSPDDVTPADRGDIPTVLTTLSTYTGQNLGTGYNTYIPHTLMDCSLVSGGRSGWFKQNVNYYIVLPGGQPAGTYNVTVTFDLVI